MTRRPSARTRELELAARRAASGPSGTTGRSAAILEHYGGQSAAAAHLRSQSPATFDARRAARVLELETIAPGIAFYICDERGRLRTHVNVFIEDEMIVDRQRLSDRLQPHSRVLIMQALSGG
jgi:hypothetical protein